MNDLDHDPEYLARLVKEGQDEVARLDRRLLEMQEARRIFKERIDHFHGASLNFGGITLHVVSQHAVQEMDTLIEATRVELLTRRGGVANDEHELANVRARAAEYYAAAEVGPGALPRGGNGGFHEPKRERRTDPADAAPTGRTVP